jgi:putative lipoic acid-binding regulatory protein
MYKIIGMKEDAVRQAISEIITDSKHSINFSNTSSSGKYISLSLEILVPNEEARNYFFNELRDHPDIKLVL